jgi:integrative and conjugative element protein (TIGR02256 family)
MVYNNPFDLENSRLLIEDLVLTDVSAFRQTEPHAAEAGGILLGYRRDVHLHVVMATPPGPSDTRSKFRFWRHDESHALIALSEWTKSCETMDYIGEWHTHPEGYPQPSTLDLHEWRKICASRKQPMVFLIQGTLDKWVGVGLGRAIAVSTAG